MEKNAMPTDDHDLLIEIKTKVMNLTDEMRLMRDDTRERLKALETSKVGVEEFRAFKLELAKEDLRVENSVKDLRIMDQSLEKKIDTALRYIYMAMGGLAVLQIVIGLLLK